jgi:hypothetical protein
LPDISELNGTAVLNVREFDRLSIELPGAFLLDTYTGAAAAYSVRQLKSGVTVAMRVRRSLPTGSPGADDEADVGFYNGIVSLDSAISNASVGVTATTLGEFLNVGTVNGTTYTNPDSLTATAACFVDEWKDQSGNGIHMEQSNPGSQPFIRSAVANTDLELENGRPILRASAGDNLTTTGITLTTANTFFFAGTQSINTSANVCAMDGNPLYRTSSGATTAVTFGFSPTPVYYHDGVLQSTTPTRDEGYTFLSGGDRLLTSVFGSRAGTDFLLGSEVGQNMAHTHEYVLWLTDQTSPTNNRPGIEANINAEYLLYQPTDQPTSGFLYDYGSATGGTDAAAAYSVRQLSDKAVLCMRVRRDLGAGNPGTDDEINIGFDANGDIDAQAISDFCRNGTGYVTRWWDQSTNGNHADQPVGGTGSNTSQPVIYSGAKVITENGKPALDFDGSNDYLQLSNLGTVSALSCFQVAKTIQTQYGGVLHCTANLNTMHQPLGTNLYDNLGTTGRVGPIAVGTDMESQYLYSTSSTGTKTVRLNGSQIHSSSQTVGIGTADHYIGLGYYTISDFYKGNIQEVILYASDQSGNFTGIETNINGFFSIF